MQNEHGGIWNLNWLIEQTGAYPVEDYVYMVKAPFHKPIFYQDSWDAFNISLAFSIASLIKNFKK